jgi:lipid-A-disaccharide synthase-like uncharacterized protein
MNTEIIGIIGATLVLIGFLLRESEKYGTGTIPYLFVNFAGSALLTIYAIILNSIPFIILDTVWGLNSLWFLMMKIFKKK